MGVSQLIPGRNQSSSTTVVLKREFQTEMFEVSVLDNNSWRCEFHTNLDCASDAYDSYVDQGFTCFMVQPSE